ncbi:RluA family pseudouridine synthase [Bdellovibrio reynosensis]|uniref:RluA family pseudouridine synthase n=1 Tax=Bdellovibrio reynosensis TaxID=2835041 RepID=A0ABY4CFJ1_9BACT|nr:RluA family pseudouridine synthase [Bdellovibrio reynosensis]UOF02546.1 RluA family pseudouridine synthase [Bdellovibrio reynosensis]
MKKIPKKYQPKGFEILHEDLDVIVGNKAPGILTVAAKWERENTVHGVLNQYIRKGNPRSTKSVFVVHRLDQATSGVLIFAKTEEVQQFLKNNWKDTKKTYYAIVHGKMEKKSGRIQSYLTEDEDYVVHSSKTSEEGKLAITEYEVLKETDKFSLVKVNLVTGKKNQIRVHFAGEGHPLVGDSKYGKPNASFKDLRLHSAELEFTHPHSKKRMNIKAPVPAYFRSLIDFEY